MSNPNAPLYRAIVAGEIIFSEKDSDIVNSIRLNTMIVHTDSNIPARLIGKAQQSLQLLFFKRMDDAAKQSGIAAPVINVHDVVILNVSPLGWATEEEFNAPATSVVKEKGKPTLKVVAANDDIKIITGAAE